MPQLGEFRANDKSQKFIWVACQLCGKERWSLVVRHKARSKLCRSCAAKLAQPFIWSNHQALTSKEKLRAKAVKARVEKLVRMGIIKKLPCAQCGNGRSLGHHPDYGKPLEIIWLCQKHHTEIHRNLTKIK